MNKLIKKECPFADEIVSYIYDEFGGSEQAAFENHLSDCIKCTDEFAAVSEARFSVFEWQKEEFAPLATPRFVIPYETQTASWFDGVRALLTGSMWPVGVAASLLIVAGFAFVLITNKPDQDVAKTDVQSSRFSVPPPATEVANNTIQAMPISGNDEKVGEIPVTKVSSEIRSVKASVYHPVRSNRQMMAESIRNESTGVDPNRSKNLRKAPVLSNFDDDDDNSLRLADLFDEGGV